MGEQQYPPADDRKDRKLYGKIWWSSSRCVNTGRQQCETGSQQCEDHFEWPFVTNRDWHSHQTNIRAERSIFRPLMCWLILVVHYSRGSSPLQLSQLPTSKLPGKGPGDGSRMSL
jgi:hypothetical protein